MEDEQGAVEQGSSGGASAPPLSDNLPSESVVENMGSDNQVQENYEDGDGAEIMVEVVGSDVYVDGINAKKEGLFESGKVGDLEGQVVEIKKGSGDVSNEGVGNKVKKSDLGLSYSRVKKRFVVKEEVDGNFSKSVNVKGDAVSALPSRGVDVVDDGVWNPGIEAKDVSSTGVSVPNSKVTGPSPSEGKRTEDEVVAKDSAVLETSEPLNNPAEAVLDEKNDTKEEKELLPSSANSASLSHFSSEASVPTEEVPGPSPMEISEEKKTEDEGVSKDSSDEGVSKDSSDLATPENLNHPAEAVLDEKADLVEKKEALPSRDNSASCGHFSSQASVPTKEAVGPSPMVISKEKKIEDEGVSKDSSDLATHETQNHPVEAVLDEKANLEEKKQASQVSAPSKEVTGPSTAVISAEEETEVEAVNKDNADLVTPEPLNHPADDVLDEKADLAETEELLPTADNSASRDHFSSVEPTEDVTGPSPTEISEEKRTEDGTVHKDSADLVIPEPLDHPAESVIDEKEEKKEVLLSGDNFESVPIEEVTGPSPVVISEEKKSEDEAVNKDSADLGALEDLNHPAEVVSDEKADIVEKEVLPSSDSSASHDHIVADSIMSHGDTKAASQDGVEHPEACLSPNCDGPQNVQVDGIDGVVGEVHLVNTSAGGEPLDSGTQEDGSFGVKDERATTDCDGSVDDKSVDEKEAIAEESKDSIVKSDALVSDDRIEGVSDAGPESIHDNSFISETEEATGNNECLKNDGDLQTHKAHEISNEPNQSTDGGDTDVGDRDKCLNVEIQDNKEKNEPNSCPSDKEIAQADPGTNSNQPVSATTLGAEIDGQDALISQAEAVDSGGSSEKPEEIRGPDDSAENMNISEEGACTKVETEDVGAIQDDNVEISGSPQSTKQEVPVQITESSNHEVGKIENNNLTRNEGASVTAVSEKAELFVSSNVSLLDGGDIKEKPGCDMASSSNEVHKFEEEDHEPRESNGFCIEEEERESDRTDDGGKDVNAELGSEGPSSETDKPKLSNEEKVKCASPLRMEQSGYLMPPEKEGRFAHSDLVWGKVRSHPWWPGQIFDPADASEKALKYHKKDAFLVAYFGDQTFAWNDSSALKPFRSHFSQIEKQSNSESFHNAVNCALEEVERRVELGLACSCIPEDAYAKIETQVVENTGIREEASQRHGVDQSSQAFHFEPNKLLEYVMGLAPRTTLRADRLDLVIARAQLSAFCRFKGYRPLAEFPLPGLLLENDADTEQVSDEMVTSKKRRHNPKDGSQSRKERNVMELVGEREFSPDGEDEFAAEDLGKSASGKKRKALDHPPAEGSEKRVSVHAAKVTASAIQTPKPSFKIGECIRRVASQLTGSTSSVKSSNDETVIDGSVIIHEQSEKQNAVVSSESLSVNEMLSQLELLAQDPKKMHHIQNNIRAFFLGFRSSIVVNRRARKKKSEQTKGGSGEEFEFDDVNDSYWTDRIVQNYSEEQTMHDGENGDRNLQVVPFDAEKPVKTGRKSHSRKRFSSGISPTAATDEDENAKRRKQEASPAELILSFAERNCVPSEINLNKMFRRFGPLMESETEVDHESGCAKVIFKRGSDAEVARNSAEKFNIFGPVLVNYQIGYSPVISVKILPLALPPPLEDAAVML